MNNQDFQNTYFPLEEARAAAAVVVAEIKQDVAQQLGGEVEDTGFAVDRILAEVLQLDPETEAAQRCLATWKNEDAEDRAERVALIIGSVDKI